MKKGKKIYFASDVHLGAPSIKDGKKHEKIFVNWLDSIKEDTAELYLLGDIFDFWFEYRHVVPRGFSRFLGKICEFTDSGIPVHFFTGNHDIWVFDYLPKETGMIIHHDPYKVELNGKSFYLAHGDGLGPYDKAYNRLKWVFTNKFLQWMFARIHPNFAVGFARKWSKQSRLKNENSDESQFLGEDKEWLMLHARDILEKEHFDYFVFGHRHLAFHKDFMDNSHFIYLGDWVNHRSYGVWDGTKFELKFLQ
ncbi:UDP-2,3-diacylglucosamine diphosphatase [Saccharicrinis fermentans]|uniref:UDP-2,3-diacylglucosamine hydrolase n=1 Tax=Saccharicrinis fermentans DSM 9555 = JCM 21142 TaxID=869213 RepID=W7Y1A5_9BACT|nr:UDP-2,3-diacylglucosamine diphosphatase [Saccharicrinis fermentans]GAF01732.1 UDP-2,3-diacylglucosamine hydrolase [Saccharicrinis fermentans DSM 9555 = JCM 21142]